MKNVAVNIKHLNFSYGQTPILRDISLAVEEGEYVALIGPNGAGKSTLIKCLNRIIKGVEYQVELFGRPLHAYKQRDLGKLIGYVAQTCEQIFPYTVREFVAMGRYPYHKRMSRLTLEDKQIIDESMAMTGLQGFADRRVMQLSGGERQKVYVAGALAQRPRILLLDEPTAHLDPRYHLELQQLILDVSRKLGITVIHVTHDLNHIEFWSTKVVALQSGRIKFLGRARDVITGQSLKDVFGAEFLLMAHPTREGHVIVPGMV